MPPLPSKLSLYIGIDPGQKGGIAVVYPDGLDADIYKMPDTERDVWDLIHGINSARLFATTAVIEQVHSMPKQGVASSFTFGKGYGGLRMALIAAKIPFTECHPRTWQKAVGISPRKKSETDRGWKNRLKGKAQQLFPELKVTLETADALLIAVYCKMVKSNG